MFNTRILFLLISVLVILCVNSCVKPETQVTSEEEEPGIAETTSEPEQEQFQTAAILARRLALYKEAVQEGDMAPFTVLPELLINSDVPRIAEDINELWWEMDWEGAHLAPLPPTEITALEAVIFPYIVARIDDFGDDNEWVLFTLGYDPDGLKYIIAEAHDEWIPEERDFYLGSRTKGCLQVWCGNFNGEWKIIAHIECLGDLSGPESPDIPFPLPTDSDNE